MPSISTHHWGSHPKLPLYGAAACCIALGLSACGGGSSGASATSSSGSSTAGAQAAGATTPSAKAKYHFYDTGTFNEAVPKPAGGKIAGSKLSTLGPNPKLGTNIKVGVLLKTLTNQYWQQVENGIKLGSKDYNITISSIQSSSSENSPQQQLQICDTMIQQGYDAFVLSPETTSNLNPCLNKLKQMNIPIVNVEGPGSGLTSSVYVGPAMLGDGQLATEYLGKHLPKASQVALIEGLPGSSASDLRKQGYLAGIKTTGLKSVADVAGNWDGPTAYNQALNIMSRYPNLKGIYAANDTMATAVVRAVKQAGKTGKVLVTGTDGIPLAVSDIKAGTQAATVTPFPFYEGYWAIEAAGRLLAGQKVPEWVDATDVVITKSNVNKYFDSSNIAKSGLFK